MQLEIGKIYNGKVKGITQYGAFVDIEGGGTGMVHISEIANTFVNEIRDHLTEEQEVRVKVIGINEAGKVSLSIKKALDPDSPQGRGRGQQRTQGGQGGQGGQSGQGGQGNQRRQNRSKPNIWEPKKQIPQSEMTFEDMMSRFKQTSEERICDLKRSTDRKNGSRRK